MAEYKMIPVDQETYDKLIELCKAYQRKQGAQVRQMVNVEWEKLGLMKFVRVDDETSNRLDTKNKIAAKAG